MLAADFETHVPLQMTVNLGEVDFAIGAVAVLEVVPETRTGIGTVTGRRRTELPMRQGPSVTGFWSKHLHTKVQQPSALLSSLRRRD